MKEISILLPKLASPAQRAILSAGVKSLEELAQMSESEVASLHGIGRNALKVIIETLSTFGMALANRKLTCPAALPMAACLARLV